MLKLTEIKVEVPTKFSKDITEHTYFVRIHPDILKNEARFKSHCKSLVKKTYGDKAVIVGVIKGE